MDNIRRNENVKMTSHCNLGQWMRVCLGGWSFKGGLPAEDLDIPSANSSQTWRQSIGRSHSSH